MMLEMSSLLNIGLMRSRQHVSNFFAKVSFYGTSKELPQTFSPSSYFSGSCSQLNKFSTSGQWEIPANVE